MNKLLNSLKIIGENENVREELIATLKSMEPKLKLSYNGDFREEITGPIVDAMFDENTVLQKTIANGLKFEYLYRTKIARDFLLSEPAVPDHVWEPQTTKLLLHLVSHAKNVLVGGAYFGDQVVMIANQMKLQEGVVHAFEPNATQNQMLIRNVTLNGLTNVRAFKKGLWKDSESQLRLVGDDSFAHAELTDGLSDTDEAFPTISIDRYLEENKIRNLDLIMLDIEGLEYPVLQGAERQLNLPKSEAPDIVFEVHRHYVDWSNGLQNSEIVKYLSAFGYEIFAIRDYNSNVNMAQCPVEIIRPEDVYLEGPPHGFNMLAVKDPSKIDTPLFRIVKNVSPKLLKHKDPQLHQPIYTGF